MGHIKEPVGITLSVDPKPLSKDEKKKISEIIDYFKATGRKMSKPIQGSRKVNSIKAKKMLTKSKS